MGGNKWRKLKIDKEMRPRKTNKERNRRRKIERGGRRKRKNLKIDKKIRTEKNK